MSQTGPKAALTCNTAIVLHSCCPAASSVLQGQNKSPVISYSNISSCEAHPVSMLSLRLERFTPLFIFFYLPYFFPKICSGVQIGFVIISLKHSLLFSFALVTKQPVSL